MAVFHEQVEIVVRTPWALSFLFDGQEATLPPNYEWDEKGEPKPIKGVRNFIPRVTLLNALNQNPIMGSQDPENPSASGALYLIGIVGKERKYPTEPLTAEEIAMQTNNPSRFDYMPLIEHKLGTRDKVEVRGNKKPRSFGVRQTTNLEIGGGD
jgi:hypothetical protein